MGLPAKTKGNPGIFQGLLPGLFGKATYSLELRWAGQQWMGRLLAIPSSRAAHG
jgi:hypothetical protein